MIIRDRSLFILYKLLLITILLLSLFLSTGCARERIERDPLDQKIIGQTFQFTEPKAYMLISEKDADDFDEIAVKTGRIVMGKNEIEDKLSIFYKYPREYFANDMTFTIIDTYWVREGIIDRQFAPDIHNVILKDQNGILSICDIFTIPTLKTNAMGELK